jgi:hypothetical protein
MSLPLLLLLVLVLVLLVLVVVVVDVSVAGADVGKVGRTGGRSINSTMNGKGKGGGGTRGAKVKTPKQLIETTFRTEVRERKKAQLAADIAANGGVVPKFVYHRGVWKDPSIFTEPVYRYTQPDDSRNTDICHLQDFNGLIQCAPEFMIIGNAKGGTTYFFKMLTLHPQVIDTEKEKWYFERPWTYPFNNPDASPMEGWMAYIRKYHHIMPEDRCIEGEATPIYAASLHIPYKLKQAFPHLKLIMLLREPVARAFSHHGWLFKKVTRSTVFSDMIRYEIKHLSSCRAGGNEEEGSDSLLYVNGPYADLISCFNEKTKAMGRLRETQYLFVRQGLYYLQINNILLHFDRSHLLVLISERMYNDPVTALQTAQKFLQLEQSPNWKKLLTDATTDKKKLKQEREMAKAKNNEAKLAREDADGNADADAGAGAGADAGAGGPRRRLHAHPGKKPLPPLDPKVPKLEKRSWADARRIGTKSQILEKDKLLLQNFYKLPNERFFDWFGPVPEWSSHKSNNKK